MGSGEERGRNRFWWRLWVSCVVVGGALFLGGGALRAVALFSVFEPFTVQLAVELPPEVRLQSYRIAVNGTPYVWAGGVAFFVGVIGSVLMRWQQLRACGWLFMALVLAALALPVELWIAFKYDLALVRLVAAGNVAVERVETAVLERVTRAGVVATLAACAEWTILLLFLWRPLERGEHEAGASGRGTA
ncbi:hypothetical protein HRbin21_01037 [bacterium HR21]|nr:hypothetical protein HRbin21_01037 [bacterium HR21]